MIKDRRSGEYIRGIVNAAIAMSEVTLDMPVDVKIDFSLEQTTVNLTYRSGVRTIENERHGMMADTVEETLAEIYIVEFKSTMPVKEIVFLIQDAIDEIGSLEYKD